MSSRSQPRPKGLRQLIEEAGGVLDAVYYVPHSLLTQRTREAALQDILARFGVGAEDCYLYSSSRKFVAVAESLGIHAEVITQDRPLARLLDELREIAAQSA